MAGVVATVDGRSATDTLTIRACHLDCVASLLCPIPSPVIILSALARLCRRLLHVK